MVRASTIVVTALALAPVFAVPLTENTEEINARSDVVEDIVELDARKFKLGKAFKKFKGLARMATKIAAPGVGALLGRDVEGEVDLEARFLPIGHHAHHPSHASHPHPHPHPSSPIAHHHPRDLDLEDGAELEARSPTVESRDLELEDGAELEARTPLSPTNFARTKSLRTGGGRSRKPRPNSKGSRKGKGGKARGRKNKSGKGLRAHGKKLGGGPRRGISRSRIGAHPRSIEDSEDDVFSRELDAESMLEDLVERGLLEVTDFDLETREPKFKLRLGKFLKKAVNVAGTVARVGASLALREEDEMEVRSDFEVLDELD